MPFHFPAPFFSRGSRKRPCGSLPSPPSIFFPPPFPPPTPNLRVRGESFFVFGAVCFFPFSPLRNFERESFPLRVFFRETARTPMSAPPPPPPPPPPPHVSADICRSPFFRDEGFGSIVAPPIPFFVCFFRASRTMVDEDLRYSFLSLTCGLGVFFSLLFFFGRTPWKPMVFATLLFGFVPFLHSQLRLPSFPFFFSS